MASQSGGKLLYFVGDTGLIFTEKSPEMVFLSAVGNRICAVMLSGAAGDQDQSDPGASVPEQLTMREFIMAASLETILWMQCCPGRITRKI